MMRRETAYKLAGRKHYHDDELQHELRRQEIRFHPLPVDQAEKARQLLERMPGLGVTMGSRPGTICVGYDLAHFTLKAIESHLEELGFHLDHSLFAKLRRAIIYFCEDTRLRNAKQPQRLIKQSNEVYIKAYEHHPHGDHDDTPLELREDR